MPSPPTAPPEDEDEDGATDVEADDDEVSMSCTSTCCQVILLISCHVMLSRPVSHVMYHMLRMMVSMNKVFVNLRCIQQNGVDGQMQIIL